MEEMIIYLIHKSQGQIIILIIDIFFHSATHALFIFKCSFYICVYLCVQTCEQVSAEARKSVIFPWIGDTGSCERLVDAGNWTQVPWRSCKLFNSQAIQF